jgi:ketosteroid isomerase-like protein
MRLFALALLLALTAPKADPRSLREADAALARAVANGDRKAFAALLDEDTFFSSGGAPLDGRAEVLESWDDLFAQGGPKLTWEPELAELASSLDLGYTAGHFRLETKDAGGLSSAHEGRYVTVWRKGPDGTFRAVADSPLKPPSSGALSGLVRTPVHRYSSQAGDLVAEVGVFALQGALQPAGTYLTVLRRTREGTLATALDSLVRAPRTAN